MGLTKCYDLKKWALIVGGIPVIGLAGDNVLTVKRSEDSYTKQVGVLGEVTRSKQYNKTGEIVLATFQSLNNQGRTIILITHEHDVAMHAKRIIHIRDGQILSDEINKNQAIADPKKEEAA